MLSTACYESRAYEKDAWPSASTLAWPILDAERFSDLSFDLLVQAGMKMGLTQKRARDRLVAMQADILNEAKALLEATESEDAQLRQELGIGIRLEGERRCLRARSEEHTSELQSLMRISYAVFCLKKKKNIHTRPYSTLQQN